MRLGVAIPSLAFANVAARALLAAAQQSTFIEGDIELFEVSDSALTLAHNLALCWGLNGYQAGQLTHLLIMHADVKPQSASWADILITEMLRARADILGCIIPLKNLLGLTSTAIDTDPWRPQRLTLLQAKQLPVTWTHERLLVNTGLLLIDLARIAALEKPPCFTFHDEIYRDKHGQWTARFEPEDWGFSRQVHAHRLRLFVTRVLGIYHCGTEIYPSAPAWGSEVDADSVQSKPIMLTDAWGQAVSFDPSRDESMDHDDLPRGWFPSADREMYRHIYKDLVPSGGTTAEIGVYRGRSLMSVADIIKLKGLKVYCVDHFGPLMGDRTEDRTNDFLAIAEEYGLSNNLHVFKSDSASAVSNIPDRSLDFVFIDADHSYESVRADIQAWERKLKPTGWLAGHDYFEPGVRRAVDEHFHQTVSVSSIWLTKATA